MGAQLIAAADGSLTGSTTFAQIEAGANASQFIKNPINNVSSGSQTSSTFTITNGVGIDAIMLAVYADGTNGTFKVDLQKGGVSQASVTVNKSDLPDANRWRVQNWHGTEPVLFKLPSTVTGDGGSNWTIVLTGTGSSNVWYAYNSTAGNMWRALRTTTLRAPVATDDLFILGELTGAGTHNSRSVTMDSTANTAYGTGVVPGTSADYKSGIFIGNYGTLAYGTSASTNYILRVNGNVAVHQHGTFNISVSGSELPRSSTAVLEFVQNTQNGDFGLWIFQNATFNCVGLSRTSGKNVSVTHLTSDMDGTGNVLDGAGGNMQNSTWVGGTGGQYPGGADGNLVCNPVLQDNSTNSYHSVGFQNQSVAGNTTVTCSVTLVRGNGTNNRYVRVYVGNSNNPGSITSGFYVDVDLQAGTLGTPGTTGTATVSGATITSVGTGYVVRMTGTVSSSSASPALVLMSCSALGTTSYVGNSTYCFGFTSMIVKAVSSLSDTTWNVADDTGWLSGDTVVVARTDRGNFDTTSIITLSANAGASSFVSPQCIAGSDRGTNLRQTIHSGSSPLQAAVGNLTRNIKIRSTSPTLWFIMYAEALASLNMQWTELYYMGTSGNTQKAGLEIWGSSTTVAKTISYCSIHDCTYAYYARTFNGTGSLNVTFNNNVTYNTTFGTYIGGNFQNADWSVSGNFITRSNNIALRLEDISGTVNNNWAGGSYNGSTSCYIGNLFGYPAPIGSFDGNSFVSGGVNLAISGSITGIINNLTLARASQYNLNPSTSTTNDLYFTNFNIFGAGSYNCYLQGQDILHMWNGRICGDTTYSTQYNLYTGSPCQFDLQNVDMSGTGSIYSPATTNDIFVSNFYQITGVLNGCLQKSSNSLSAKTNWTTGNWISYQKYNGTAGDHRTEMYYGTIKTDTTIYNTASPSVRMTPNSASKKLLSAPKGRGFIVAVASGQSVNIGVYIRKSAAGDGAAYNGNQPRLIQVANPALGQNSDVVIATYSASTGSWNQISGTSSTATDDGAWEFVIDCDGTAGWINFDDWSIS